MTCDSSPGDGGLEHVGACLFCGSEDAATAITGVRDVFFNADDGVFDFRRCNECGSLWMPERPTGDRLLLAYANYYTHGETQSDPGRPTFAVRVRDAYARARFSSSPRRGDRAVAALVRVFGIDLSSVDAKYRFTPPAPARLLDYGCGNGAFLMTMRRFGHELRGAEYDPALLGHLGEYGIPVDDVTKLSDSSWDAHFDHITLAHVIEHVADPRALLRRLYTWLKPGGSLYIEVPNADATGLRLFDANWRGLEAPRHFALPSRAGLKQAIERAGFMFETQHIEPITRGWVWQESLATCDAASRASLRAAMEAAPAETERNAEFLTLLARRPSAP